MSSILVSAELKSGLHGNDSTSMGLPVDRGPSSIQFESSYLLKVPMLWDCALAVISELLVDVLQAGGDCLSRRH